MSGFSQLTARIVSGPEMFRKQGNSFRHFKGYFSNRHLQARILPPQPASPVSAVRFPGVEEPPGSSGIETLRKNRVRLTGYRTIVPCLRGPTRFLSADQNNGS